MNCKSFFKKNRTGAILPLVVLIVLLLMIIGLGVTGLGLHSRLFAIQSADNIVARTAADAAVNDALSKMNEKIKIKPWNDSSLPAATDVALLNSDATYDYQVIDNNDIYTIEATGRSANHVHTISSSLRLFSMFEYALFAKHGIDLKHCSKIDWINHKNGDPPFEVGTASIATGAVQLMSGAMINGNVAVGMDGDPEVVINGKHNATITGISYPYTYVPPVPSVVVPDFLASMGSSGQLKNTATLNASAKYSSINLGNSKVLTITKPISIYVTGSVLLGNDAMIKIEGGGSLNLYVGGTFDGANSAGFNNGTADSRNLGIYCLDTCTKVIFKNSGDFYGTIYAPNAAVTIDNSADVYGSVVSDSFMLKATGRLIYDANLRNRNINEEGVRFVINRWSED